MMPIGGGDARGEALSALRGLTHQQATHERLSGLFAAAAKEAAALSPWQQANLRLMKREWVRATALPQDLVEAMSRADLVLIIGTSLVVFPAASLPDYRLPAAELAIVNRDPTHLDHAAAVVTHDDLAAVFQALDALS